ncbi:DEAD/DEAH box helicase [Shewanella canadensis]|uniref:DEAD-box ATP-dependent RNA helicase RhpA n=1 Tax=Shewanella canadensis TaxID=271096 RepID=A0A3S0KA15_9GAMM|nr:DEAD/DEAH box helicase [Shewanella canadensis]RTR38890.1 DEAD/DEAH box helicase [Shewanella canadensis]
MSFSTLGLSAPILNAISELGYLTPTPIQAEAIPLALKGKNLIAAAQTGSGKTATFVLPILETLARGETQRKKRVRALILTPTRELAVQVCKSIEAYGKNLNLKSIAIYGGVDYAPQKQALIDGVDIVVATPGRLRDLYTQRAIHFDEIEMLVLDEADRMLDMGFIEDITKIIDTLPEERQNLLFSATLSRQVRELAKDTVSNAIQLSFNKERAGKPNIDQWLITVDKDKKSALLSHLINENNWQQALIFIETKHGAGKLVSQLEKRGIEAECIHSGRTQAIREKILADFKAGKIKYLISTGVSARGIDIDVLPLVINYDLPFPADEYVHRIGRTGRAGAAGEAISLVSKDDFKNLCMIERRLDHLIERKVVEGFEPSKVVPVSVLNFVPKNKPVRDAAPKEECGRSQSSKPDYSKRDSSKSNSSKDRSSKNRSSSNNRSDNKESSADNKLPLNPWNR